MLGVAMCGGGIKCAAHLGVLQVFRRHGLEFDMVAGSSAGALIGALYAMGADLDALEQSLEQVRGRDVLRFTMGSHGFGDYKRFRRFLQTIMGQRCIEELPRRLVVTAADLAGGTICLIDKGDLVDAVYASCAVPGIFQPLYRDNQVLVDGSLLEPLPVQVLKQRGATFVVGVYFTSEQGNPPSGPFETVHRSFQVMMHQMAVRSIAAADLMVEPPISHCGIFDFVRLRDCLQAGRRAAEEALPVLTDRLRAWREATGAATMVPTPAVAAQVEPT